MAYSMPQLYDKRHLRINLWCVASLPVLALGLLLPGIAKATPDLSEFNLVFSDEFNGSTLDAQKWNTGYLWGPYLPINKENTNPDSQKAAILALVNEGSLVNVTNSFTQETATVRQVPAPA